MKKALFILALLIILLRPWPDPNIYGSLVRLTEAAVLGLLLCIAIMLTIYNSFRLPSSSMFWSYITLLVFGLYFPLLVNVSSLSTSDYIEFLRLPYTVTLILIGYYAAKNHGIDNAGKIFFKIIIIFALLQIPLSIAQLKISGFAESISFIYSSHKIETFRIRATGTFGNPNHLALFLLIGQISVLTCRQKGCAILWGVLYFGVILTGSVAITALAPVILIIYFIYYSAINGVRYSSMLVFCGSIILLPVGLLWLSENAIAFHPRLEGLRKTLFDSSTKDLFEIRNLHLRLNIWKDRFELYNWNDLKMLWAGMGPMKRRGLDYLDNEVLFIFLRYGILGLICAIGRWMILAVTFFKKRSRIAFCGCFIVLSFSFLVPVYEVFSLWRFMPYYLLPLGMVLASERGRSGDKVDVCGRGITQIEDPCH